MRIPSTAGAKGQISLTASVVLQQLVFAGPHAQGKSGQGKAANTIDARDRGLIVGHFAIPKRGLRLSSPVLSSLDTMDFVARSLRWLARNCVRHSTIQPLPFACTSSLPE